MICFSQTYVTVGFGGWITVQASVLLCNYFTMSIIMSLSEATQDFLFNTHRKDKMGYTIFIFIFCKRSKDLKQIF